MSIPTAAGRHRRGGQLGPRGTSGRWFSPYDGATWTAASDVDIDHIVPLKERLVLRRLGLDHGEA